MIEQVLQDDSAAHAPADQVHRTEAQFRDHGADQFPGGGGDLFRPVDHIGHRADGPPGPYGDILDTRRHP